MATIYDDHCLLYAGNFFLLRNENERLHKLYVRVYSISRRHVDMITVPGLESILSRLRNIESGSHL